MRTYQRAEREWRNGTILIESDSIQPMEINLIGNWLADKTATEYQYIMSVYPAVSHIAFVR